MTGRDALSPTVAACEMDMPPGADSARVAVGYRRFIISYALAASCDASQGIR